MSLWLRTMTSTKKVGLRTEEKPSFNFPLFVQYSENVTISLSVGQVKKRIRDKPIQSPVTQPQKIQTFQNLKHFCKLRLKRLVDKLCSDYLLSQNILPSLSLHSSYFILKVKMEIMVMKDTFQTHLLLLRIHTKAKDFLDQYTLKTEWEDKTVENFKILFLQGQFMEMALYLLFFYRSCVTQIESLSRKFWRSIFTKDGHKCLDYLFNLKKYQGLYCPYGYIDKWPR